MVFDEVQLERLPAIRKMSSALLEEFSIRLDRQLGQVEAAVARAREHRLSAAEAGTMGKALEQLNRVLAEQAPRHHP
jgi:hypothetical protein